MSGIHELGSRVFRYAVLSDTHIRPEEESSSPWETNLMTNDRARWVVDRINGVEPDLVIHLGDIVHPLPHLQTHGSAAEAALKILGGVKAPLFLLPGNHEVGDKNNPTVPAYIVDELGLDVYRKWFGPLFQSFDHGGIHFVLINSPALNSGLDHEEEHTSWLEGDLEEKRGERIHLFSHYPPYVLEPGEPSNYDNVDQPSRAWLLDLLDEYEVEAFFAGHVHHFLYQRLGPTDFYNMLSTCFVRQDYSEMFRVEAAEEYGRNDVAKLGWALVDVYNSDHVVRIMRSYGATKEVVEPAGAEFSHVSRYHPKENPLSPVGVHLRHPWAEVVEMPYNGPIDEFIRKRVRNDYIILGLWESGIRRLRVPLRDFQGDSTRERIKALTRMGHRFCFFEVGLPSEKATELLSRERELVDLIEVIIPWNEAADSIQELKRLREKIEAPLYLANIESSVHRGAEGPKFSHYVSYGFHVHDTSSIEDFLSNEDASRASDGFLFSVGFHESPWESIKRIEAYASRKRITAIANVRLASENPAEFMDDEVTVASRAAEAFMAAATVKKVGVFIDTFMDLDRGYFPRVGLYDRRVNPRMGSHVFANLQGVFNHMGIESSEQWEENGWKVVCLESLDASYKLFLPISKSVDGIDFEAPQGKQCVGGEVKIIDLVSGSIYDYESDSELDQIRQRPHMFVTGKN